MINKKCEDFFNLNEKAGDSDDDNFEVALKKKQFEGNKGKMLLELQKTYKGDDRFKFDKKFSNDIEVNRISYGVKELTDVFDKRKEDIKKPFPSKLKNKGTVTIEDELREEKQRNISILSKIISNEDFLSIRPKTTNHQSLIIKRFDPLLNIGKEIVNKVEEEIAQEKETNKIKLKKGIDFEKTVKTNYHENIEEFNLEKKLEININAWKDLNAQNKQNKQMNIQSTFLLFDTQNNPEPTTNLLFNQAKKDETHTKTLSESEKIIPVKKKKEKREPTLLEKREMEMKKKQKTETEKEKKKKKREIREFKEKDIEQKIVSTFSEAYGPEKTQEYIRIVKLIKEKKFQNLRKKRNKPLNNS